MTLKRVFALVVFFLAISSVAKAETPKELCQNSLAEGSYQATLGGIEGQATVNIICTGTESMVATVVSQKSDSVSYSMIFPVITETEVQFLSFSPLISDAITVGTPNLGVQLRLNKASLIKGAGEGFFEAKVDNTKFLIRIESIAEMTRITAKPGSDGTA